MLEAVDTDLWLTEGPVVDFHGFPYPTRSIIVRLPDHVTATLAAKAAADKATKAQREAAAPPPPRSVSSQSPPPPPLASP